MAAEDAVSLLTVIEAKGPVIIDALAPSGNLMGTEVDAHPLVAKQVESGPLASEFLAPQGKPLQGQVKMTEKRRDESFRKGLVKRLGVERDQ